MSGVDVASVYATRPMSDHTLDGEMSLGRGTDWGTVDQQGGCKGRGGGGGREWGGDAARSGNTLGGQPHHCVSNLVFQAFPAHMAADWGGGIGKEVAESVT